MSQTLTTRDAARDLIERGFSVLPLPPKSKRAIQENWPDFYCAADEVEHVFKDNDNIGILLGRNGLVEVDLDNDQLAMIAADFLPPTPMRSGRESRPNTHWWYRVAEPPSTVMYKGNGVGSLVEIRSTGAQTLVAPSTHPDSGERYQWDSFDDPAEVDLVDLRERVTDLALATLFGTYYPGEGQRHDFVLALSGGLLRQDLAVERVRRIVKGAATIGGDDEIEERLKDVEDTAIALGERKNVTGWPTLQSIIGKKGNEVRALALRWLNATTSPAEANSYGSISEEVLARFDEAKAQNRLDEFFLNDDFFQRAAEAYMEDTAFEVNIQKRVTRDLKGVTWAIFKRSLDRNVKKLRTRAVLDGGQPANGDILEAEDGYVKIVYKKDIPIKERLSNFTLRPLEILKVPNNDPFLAAEIVKDDDVIAREDIPLAAFSGRKDFLKYIPSWDTSWFGSSDVDLQRLKPVLSAHNPPTRHGVLEIGRHTIDGKDYIVLPGLVLDRNGVVANPEIRFTDPRGNPIAKQLTNHDTLPLKWEYTDEEVREAQRAVFTKLPYINEPHVTLTLLSLHFALPWADKMRTDPSTHSGFPTTGLVGEKGSGKTTTAQIVARLSGFPIEVKPHSATGSTFVSLRALSSTNMLPAWLDEYRISAFRNKSDHEQFMEALRLLWNRSTRDKGLPSLDSVTYHYSAPALICGESEFPDAAVRARGPIIRMPPAEEVTDAQRATLAEVVAAPLGAFALPYWVWSLNQDDWYEVRKEALSEVQDWLAERNFASLDPRVEVWLSALLFGWRMAERYALSCGYDLSALSGSTVMGGLLRNVETMTEGGRPRSEVDVLFEMLHACAQLGRLRRGVHFRRLSDDTIALNNVVAINEAIKYAKEVSQEHTLREPAAYKSLFEEAARRPSHPYILGTKDRERFDAEDGSKLQPRNVIVFDPAKLDESLGLDAGAWTQEEGVSMPPSRLSYTGAV